MGKRGCQGPFFPKLPVFPDRAPTYKISGSQKPAGGLILGFVASQYEEKYPLPLLGRFLGLPFRTPPGRGPRDKNEKTPFPCRRLGVFGSLSNSPFLPSRQRSALNRPVDRRKANNGKSKGFYVYDVNLSGGVGFPLFSFLFLPFPIEEVSSSRGEKN